MQKITAVACLFMRLGTAYSEDLWDLLHLLGEGARGDLCERLPQLLTVRQPVQHLGELQGLLLGDFGTAQNRIACHGGDVVLGIDQCHGADADRLGDLNFRMFSSSSISMMLVTELIEPTPASAQGSHLLACRRNDRIAPLTLRTPWLSIALPDGATLHASAPHLFPTGRGKPRHAELVRRDQDPGELVKLTFFQERHPSPYGIAATRLPGFGRFIVQSDQRG
jgi:hypothetical protein